MTPPPADPDRTQWCMMPSPSRSTAGVSRRTAVLALILVALASLLVRVAHADDLLAHASENTLWVSSTRNVPRDFSGMGGQRTEIRYRSLDGEPTWRQLPDLTGRAVDLASRGSSLAV